ncbi:hypothetical protein [Chryseobacterium culicis]|uniref:hypothetical protein n=1 Tax=Chryseobacterium culicis TaxID=680127 RepID=UPI002896B0AE|nr:hypothetical protein [Chryseobacterium culicis]
MKLTELVRAVRENNLDQIIQSDLKKLEREKIIIYAMFSIAIDTDYQLMELSEESGRIVQVGGMNFERLCSVTEFEYLVDQYLIDGRKSDEILVIEIIDHFFSQ